MSKNALNAHQGHGGNQPVPDRMSQDGSRHISDPLIPADCRSFVSMADIHHSGTIDVPSHGLPIGNGIMGSLVWNANASTLKLQLNRVDVFGYNSAGTDVKDHEDYGYGCGFVSIDLGGTPFERGTSQHLNLYEGKLTIHGEGVCIDIIADMDADIFAVRITDTRKIPSIAAIDLTMLQAPDVTVGTHSATLRTSDCNGRIRLKQVFQQPAATGFSQFDHYCASAVVIGVDGRSSTVSYPDAMTARLSLPAAAGSFVVYMGSHAAMCRETDVIAEADEKVREAITGGFDVIDAGNRRWWEDFWSKSHVHLPDDKAAVRYQKKWTYFQYLSAISMRGRYPAKFSGLFWNANGLQLPWGAMFWGYNQECLHYSHDAANHSELMNPYLRMHIGNYNGYAEAAMQQWGSQGIFINETEAHNGPELLPDAIAADLKCYMLEGAGPTDALASFASARHWHISRWQIFPTHWTTFIMINAAEKAEHYWNRYLYTLDGDFLASQAYPMLKGAAEFYRTFPNLKRESDGKWHIFRTSLHEHILGGTDNVDDLTFIKGVMQAAGMAASILDVDAVLRLLWREIADNLAPYPVSGQPDAIGSISHPEGKVTWCQGKMPAVATRGLYGAESPRLRMVENYDLLTLETKEQGLDNGEWELAVNTFEAHPGYVSNMEHGDYQYAGGRYVLDAARLGRHEYQKILDNLDRKIDEKTMASANRLGFTTSDLEELQGYGIFSAGLQEGLMQSIAPAPGATPVIRVFPTWDLEKSASFKLLAKGGFLVSSSVKNGVIRFVNIDSQLGGVCGIRSPWPGDGVALFRNGLEAEILFGHLLEFSTGIGEQVELARLGAGMDSCDEEPHIRKERRNDCDE